MKRIYKIYSLLLVVVIFSSCSKRTVLVPTNEVHRKALSPTPMIVSPTTTIFPISRMTETPIPTSGKTNTPIPTTVRISTSTFTPTISPTLTSTQSPKATLEPQQAQQVLALFQKPFDCELPCFWGIVPEKTTISETEKVFSDLGLQLIFMNTHDGNDYYYLSYKFENDIKIGIQVIVQYSIVKNLRILIQPELFKEGAHRKWITYSPETVIAQFGMPTSVKIWADFGPRPVYGMTFFYDTLGLWIDYAYGFFTHAQSKLQICPLIDEFSGITIWIGKPSIEYTPSGHVPLEEVTSITMDEFFELMTGRPDQACMELKQDVLLNYRK
jgi:hypothetical protein